MTATTHIAGPSVTVDGRHLRQRCGWCGASLLDYDVAGIAVPEGQDPVPGTWPVGALVTVDGAVSVLAVDLGSGTVPEDSCAHPATTAKKDRP